MDAPVSFAGLDLGSTAARPAGNCSRCGGQLYENLYHLCSTSVRPGSFRLNTGAESSDPWETLAAKPVVEQPASVGLVCVCGRAVATIAGTTASCECGRVWMVSAMRIAGP